MNKDVYSLALIFHFREQDTDSSFEKVTIFTPANGLLAFSNNYILQTIYYECTFFFFQTL